MFASKFVNETDSSTSTALPFAAHTRTGLLRVVGFAVILGAVCSALGQIQEEWVARYDGPHNSIDVGRALVVDSAGNVYVTGASHGGTEGSNYDIATLKYDASGNLIWERRFNGQANLDDSALDIVVDGLGNVYVTGYSNAFAGDRDYVTLKYDSNGNLIWTQLYGGPGNGHDYGVSLAVDDVGNVIVTGRSVGVDSADDFATLKYDSDGNLLWVERYNGPANYVDCATALAVDGAGSVYVTGWSYGSGTSYDYVTVKYDADGRLLWVRRYNGPRSLKDFAISLALDGEGNVYVTGWSYGSGTSYDYVTVKYDTNGNLLWDSRYATQYFDYASGIAVDDAGNVYVTGVSRDSYESWIDSDYLTIKYDSNGNLMWIQRYDGHGGGKATATALAVDSEGTVYVTGYTRTADQNFDYVTVVYSANGSLLSELPYNGSENGADFAYAVVIDDAGNVYVTGTSESPTYYDFVTIKYSPDFEVLPDSYSLFRGVLTGGGLSDLLASDDSWMTVEPGITLNQAERPVQLIIEGTAPTEAPSELRIRVEAHADIPNIGQWIDLWNYDTNSYEEVDFMIATTADSIVEVSITTNPERFIQAGTKQMKARISYKEAGIVLLFPWLISFDQTVWVIVP